MKASASQKLVIRNQQVHTGPADLNIPELPEDASDDEIDAALANLEAAQKRLIAKRKALAEDAEGFFVPDSPNISEDLASLRSKQIKGILKESAKSITDLTGMGDL